LFVLLVLLLLLLLLSFYNWVACVVLFLALLLLFRIVVVNTKVGSDFNLSINAKQRDLQRYKMWTRNQLMRFSFCVSMMLYQKCKNTCDLFSSHQLNANNAEMVLNAWHSVTIMNMTHI